MTVRIVAMLNLGVLQGRHTDTAFITASRGPLDAQQHDSDADFHRSQVQIEGTWF